MTGTIFNIQRFSIHDGPGIRSTVFMKGCNLRCFWCHNPESFVQEEDILFYKDKCIGCGNCVRACSRGCHQIEDGKNQFNHSTCNKCGKCSEVCYMEALIKMGHKVTTEEVMKEVARDRLFYEESGGGLTISGGEPLLQVEFVKELLKEARSQGIHTALDTAGNVDFEVIKSVAPFVDLFLWDMKAIDEEQHKKGTGVSNKRILENLRLLSALGNKIWIRVPIIPDFNDTIGYMEQISEYIKDLRSIEYVELMPFHRMGSNKYNALGLKYAAEETRIPSKEHINKLQDYLLGKAIHVRSN